MPAIRSKLHIEWQQGGLHLLDQNEITFQVVGNLIYYRYMNPAIVAPDAFDIVSFGVDKNLTLDQVHINFINLFFVPLSLSEWLLTQTYHLCEILFELTHVFS